MAEEGNNGASQFELGKLFVDIGSKGLGPLVKGLNSLSASFLLTKNAANQFIKPIRDIMKESGSDALNLGKLESSMGLGYKNLQQLTSYFEARNLDKGMINDITALQTKFYNLSHGFSGIDEGTARAFNLMGLSVNDYNGDLESTIQLLSDVREKTKDLNQLDRAARLRDLGLNPEWAYAFDRSDFNLSDSLIISDKEIEQKLEAEEAKAQVEVAKKRLFDKLGAKVAPVEKNIYQGAEALMTGDNLTKSQRAAGGVAVGGGIGAGALTGLAIGGPIGAVVGGGIGLLTAGTALNKIGEKANSGIEQKPSSEWSVLGNKAPNLPDINNIGYGEPNTNDINYNNNPNVTINNTNNINGDNPKDIAFEIMKNDTLEIKEIQNMQYQQNNRPGS